MARRTDGHPSRGTRLTALLLLVACIATLHFAIPTTTHGWHELHIVLRKAYFIPPVLAAVWFGLGGAAWTTLAVSVLFTGHAFLNWPGNYMEQANQVGELATFWVVGLLAGYWFDRQRSLLEGLATAHEETVNGLVSALDLREHHTGMHSQRVRAYTLLLADQLGVSEQSRRDIAYGALLHDVGKIAVPDHILLKPGRLTDDEWQEVRKHPEEGYQIIRRVPFLRNAADIVRTHHERIDGSGYPRGLTGGQIPLGARLFAVADVYDALTSDRPYHAASTYEQAAAEIWAGLGSHFAPTAVAAFFAVPRAALESVAGRWHDVEGAASPSDAVLAAAGVPTLVTSKGD
jgi:putative nucleotidyltransferase with HDIG domain